MGCEWWDLECQAREAAQAVENQARSTVGQISNATGFDLFNPADVADAALNYMTGGALGVNRDGNIKMGTTTRLIDETIGQVSGRNQARKQNMLAQDALDAAKAAKDQLLKDELQRKKELDTQASTQAGLLQQSQYAQAQKEMLGSAEATMTRDFLGL